VGNFNAILADSLAITVNEVVAFAKAGDQGKLKNLISAERLTVNRKYKDATNTPIRARIFFTTNETYAFNVDRAERRLLYVDTSSRFAHDAEHFRRLVEAIDKGYIDFARFLLERDISEYDYRDVPAIADSKISDARQSASGLDSFLVDWFTDALQGGIHPQLYQKAGQKWSGPREADLHEEDGWLSSVSLADAIQSTMPARYGEYYSTKQLGNERRNVNLIVKRLPKAEGRDRVRLIEWNRKKIVDYLLDSGLINAAEYDDFILRYIDRIL
jgi:hypothetical protein